MSDRTKMRSRRGAAAAATIAFVAVVGAAAYLLGTREHSMDHAEIEALVKELVGSSKPAPSAARTENDTASSSVGLSNDQRTEVESTIRNYLIANPEIVRDAINELQRKEDEASRVAQASIIKDNSELLFDSPRQIVLGNPKGDVTLVEFFDYNCGYCRRAHADMKLLIEEDPNLRFVLKEFPILGEGSVAAAQVAVAVLMTAPEKYSAFHDLLISEKGQVDGAKALAVATDLGLDPEVLKVTASSDEAKANIAEVRDLAAKLDLTGTPSYATKLKVVVGAVGFEGLKAEIDSVRQACKASANC